MCELREKATFHKETGLIPVMDAEATVVKSESIVPGWLRESLALGVRPLEDIPDLFKDWHPGSDQMVLDLVHPSLFPIVYGRSRVLPSGRVPFHDCARYTGLGETIQEHNAGQFHVELSFGNTAALRPWGGYQCLPTQIDFIPDGRPSIASYTNNLPPAHEGLYKVLEQLVDKSIPLWNECLSWFHKRLRIDVSITSNDDYEIPEGVTWPRPNTNLGLSADNHEAEDEMDDLMWSWEHGFEDDYMEWWEANRVLTYPEPRTFRPTNRAIQGAGARLVDLKSEYNASGLQVIFKLANIHLTPEKPEYNGGRWHIEGAMNEHICATALYYYDSENISTSYLAFRQSIDVEAMVSKPAQVSNRPGIIPSSIHTLTISRVNTLQPASTSASRTRAWRSNTWVRYRPPKAASLPSRTSCSIRYSRSASSTPRSRTTGRSWPCSWSTRTSASSRRPMCHRSNGTGGPRR